MLYLVIIKKHKYMNADIHFTDDQGNEFYIGIRNGELSQIWKNRVDIKLKDSNIYFEESDDTEKYPGMFIDNEEWVEKWVDRFGSAK